MKEKKEKRPSSNFTLTEIHRRTLRWLETETQLAQSEHVRRALDFYFGALYRSALRMHERELNIRTRKEPENTSNNLQKVEIESLEQADDMIGKLHLPFTPHAPK